MAGAEERVTPLELFFDLIFVFAITQVTGFVVEDPTWAGLAKGLLVLGVLWWAWAAYAWLTNTINPEEGAVRIAMFAAMGAMLVASLAVPDVFGDDAFVFACAYAFVRIAHLVLYAIAGRGDRDLLAAIARLGVGTAIGVGLLFVAAGARRPAPGCDVGACADLRPARRLRRRRQGLAALRRALRRAPRADRDHRARRVDRRARPGGQPRARHRPRRRGSARLRGCGRAVVALLRRGRDRGGAQAARADRQRAACDGA